MTEFNPSLNSKPGPLVEQQLAWNRPVDVIATVNSSPPNSTTRLIEGDCVSVMTEMADREFQSIHALVTDPPYYLDGFDTSWKKGRQKVKRSGAVGGLPPGMAFDKVQGRKLQDFIGKVAGAALPLLKPGAFALWFSQPRLAHRMAVGIEEAGFEIRDVYAWHFTRNAQSKAFKMDHFIEKRAIPEADKSALKDAFAERKTAMLRPQFESIILAQKPFADTLVGNWVKHRTGLISPSASLDGYTPSTVMRVEKSKRAEYNNHLTVKPLRLFRHLISLFTMPGQSVLDPFLGSGTTAVAAAQLGRHCVGIEYDPEYLVIANRRLRDEVL